MLSVIFLIILNRSVYSDFNLLHKEIGLSKYFSYLFRLFHSNSISVIPDGAFGGNPLLKTM